MRARLDQARRDLACPLQEAAAGAHARDRAAQFRPGQVPHARRARFRGEMGRPDPDRELRRAGRPGQGRSKGTATVVQRQAGRALVGELVDQRVTDEVASSYLDVWGKERTIDPEVRSALLKAMGPARKAGKVELEPGRCYQPEVLEQQRLWGFMTQLYGLRSERNWGIGDFTDLRKLIEIAARLGAAVGGGNPL